MSDEVDPRLEIGILGGGQLGRMLALAGYRLGFATTVLDPKVRVSASKVCNHIQAEFDDPAAVAELAERADVVTYEFENVPVETLRQIEGSVPIHPTPHALEVTSDRRREKEFFETIDVDTAAWRAVDSADDLHGAADELGLPLVVKSRRFGYDGKGQVRIDRRDQIEDAWSSLGERPAIAEELVEFDRELSVLGVRSRGDSVRTYPLVENIHREGILVESRAPAPGASPELVDRAQSACRRLLRELDYVGTLALELFETGDRLLANEFAPRVHNSGHWSIEGAATSQFENHVRAVAALPLGSTEALGESRMLNIIGRWPERRRALEIDGLRLHDYEKEARPGRKIGHVTVRGDSLERADALADRVRPLVADRRDLG